MEVSGRRQASSADSDTGIPCDPCLIDNENENAQFYCTNCDEFLCDTCARNHRKYKASSQHQLLDRDEMPGKKISNAQDKFCATHDGKLVEYLCDKHNTFGCSVCVTLYHVQCGVKYIDDLAAEFSTSQEYKSLLKKIKDTEKQLAEYKNKTQNDSIDVTSCFRQLKADIQVFRSIINSKIDAFEHELMQQAEQIKNEDLKAIESVDILNNKLLEDMSEISCTLGLLEQCKQNQQLFISAKKAQTQVKEYNDKARKKLQEISVRRYAFSPNENILNTLNSPSKLGLLEMKNEGERRTEKKEQTEVGIMKKDNPTISMLGIKRKDKGGEKRLTQNEEKTMNTFKSTKLKFMKNIKMNHNKDIAGVKITGSVLMSSDILAVVDCYNKSIKVVDLRSHTITCYIKLDGEPRDITCIDPETLVVTYNTYLVFLRYENKSRFQRHHIYLTVTKKVQMESDCYGITYRKGKLFVTFSMGSPSVKILNIDGKVLQIFKHNDKGQNLFVCPGYIIVNSDGDTMYIADYDQHTVTSLSMDGKVCNIYKHDRLRAPTGLTLGDGDSIYVAGYESDNIHKITPTCTPVRIVLEEKDGLSCPQTVLYNNTDKTLYVSSEYTSDNLLHVYKLE